MNRTEFEDRICAVRRELQWLEAINHGCQGCADFNEGTCKRFGQVPSAFIVAGCDQWSWDDVPF